MLLSELIDLVFVESGQFILDDLTDLSLNKDKFWILVRSQLALYEKYRPFTWSTTLQFSQKHTFTNKVDDPLLPLADQKLIEAIPLWISSAVPVESFSVPSMSMTYRAFNMSPSSRQQMEPINWIWKYEKPDLYAPYQGKLDVTMHGSYITDVTLATGGGVKEVDMKGLPLDSEFIDLVTGKFLIAIGRSRRAFTVTDIPVTLDADTLVVEGNELVTRAKETLIERSHFHFAVGN